MDVLPAIDLRDGNVVRLLEGDYDRQTTYASDPAEVAREFAAAGAQWIHVVDLDAARSGQPTNTPAIRAIREAVNLRIELGGGARDEATIDAMLAGGVDRVVVGSAALKNWSWFSELMTRRDDLAGRVVLGLDARDGRLAVHGWTEQIDTTPADLAQAARELPLAAIVYTDISRDGMLAGVNIEATARLVRAAGCPVIASGGVASIDDVHRCRAIDCGGIIIGKAYYEGRVDLAQAIQVASGP
jgi:phosphoribosylformimino-5-aminoimidazole carboxamide ribotide isomerase